MIPNSAYCHQNICPQPFSLRRLLGPSYARIRSALEGTKDILLSRRRLWRTTWHHCSVTALDIADFVLRVVYEIGKFPSVYVQTYKEIRREQKEARALRAAKHQQKQVDLIIAALAVAGVAAPASAPAPAPAAAPAAATTATLIKHRAL